MKLQAANTAYCNLATESCRCKTKCHAQKQQGRAAHAGRRVWLMQPSSRASTLQTCHTQSCQHEMWCAVVQAHAKEPAILQAVVDQADLVREKDFGGIMSGTEKEAVRKLFIRLAHCGYQVRSNKYHADVLVDMQFCCTCPSLLCKIHVHICTCKASPLGFMHYHSTYL